MREKKYHRACFACGHKWESDLILSPQTMCPRCRRHFVVDGMEYDKAVVEVIKMMRTFPPDPLEGMSLTLDKGLELVKSRFPRMSLPGAAAIRLVEDALIRLGARRH